MPSQQKRYGKGLVKTRNAYDIYNQQVNNYLTLANDQHQRSSSPHKQSLVLGQSPDVRCGFQSYREVNPMLEELTNSMPKFTNLQDQVNMQYGSL